MNITIQHVGTHKFCPWLLTTIVHADEPTTEEAVDGTESSIDAATDSFQNPTVVAGDQTEEQLSKQESGTDVATVADDATENALEPVPPSQDSRDGDVTARVEVKNTEPNEKVSAP